MAMFNSYVKLPEGMSTLKLCGSRWPDSLTEWRVFVFCFDMLRLNVAFPLPEWFWENSAGLWWLLHGSVVTWGRLGPPSCGGRLRRCRDLGGWISCLEQAQLRWQLSLLSSDDLHSDGEKQLGCMRTCAPHEDWCQQKGIPRLAM